MYKVIYTSASQTLCRDVNMGRQGFINGSLAQASTEPSVLWQFQKGQKRGIFVILQFGRQENGEGYSLPWLRSYPILFQESLKIIIPFPSSYLCEVGFSAVAFIKDKYRNRLDEKHPEHLALSDVELPFQKLVETKWDLMVRNKSSALCVFFLLFCNYLVGSLLFLKTVFLSKSGSQKKIVEKH